MPKGYSLHIGLNSVNPDAYDGWSGELISCESDMEAMSKLCVQGGYELTYRFPTRTANAIEIETIIAEYSTKLEAGDFFCFTYSGHGGQIPDIDNDEPDSFDETICLYDRMMLDDELAAMWAMFKPGVRITAIFDCCHSGSMAREKVSKKHARMIPANVAFRMCYKNPSIYWNEKAEVKFRNNEIKASVISIGACRDNQYAMDGEKNGLFTSKLLKTMYVDPYKRGTMGFMGNLRRLHTAVWKMMPASQKPVMDTFGMKDRVFQLNPAFRVR